MAAAPAQHREPAGPVHGRVAQLALLSELGTIGFTGAVVVLHVVRRDLDPAARTLSEYAIGPYGWLMALAFLALGGGGLALAAALAGARPRPPSGRSTPALLAIFGLGTTACAFFTSDSSLPGTPVTAAGQIHNVAATVALFAGLAALPAAAWSWRSAPRWRNLRWPSVALALLAAMGIPALGGGAGFGAAERLFVAVLLLWQWVVAQCLQAAARGA